MASNILNDLIANKFQKLSGLAVSGTVPLRQELVNELLADMVEKWSAPQPASTTAERSTSPLSDLLGLVRKVQVTAEPGVIRLDFEIRA